MTLCLFLFSVVAVRAAAPEASPASQGVEARPPAVGSLRSYKMPRTSRWRLDNGLEAVLVEDRRLPLITARLLFRGGTAAVPAENAGLAEAMAELLTDGTARRGSKEISDAAEEYGGTISAEAQPDGIILAGHCLAEHADKMFELMSEVAQSASFPEKEVALRKKNMQEELNLSRSEGDFLASVAFYKKLFKSHPYAITAPTDESIARLTRELVVAVHRDMITPRRAVFVLVGDISRSRAQKALKRYFGPWTASAGPAEAAAVAAPRELRSVFLVDRPGAVQASIFMGNLAIREDNPDYFNLLVVNQVLGGSFSSRLVQDIRETKGYTYRIGSRLEHRLTFSIFRVRTPVRTEVAGPALSAIFDHLSRIREKGVTPEELKKAQSYLSGSFARSLET